MDKNDVSQFRLTDAAFDAAVTTREIILRWASFDSISLPFILPIYITRWNSYDGNVIPVFNQPLHPEKLFIQKYAKTGNILPDTQSTGYWKLLEDPYQVIFAIYAFLQMDDLSDFTIRRQKYNSFVHRAQCNKFIFSFFSLEKWITRALQK